MDEKYLEQASLLTENQRNAQMRNIQDRLKGAGQDECENCNETISFDRRQAVPSATRCIQCQSIHERSRGSFNASKR